MRLQIAWIQSGRGKDKSAAIQSLTADYVKRIRRYTPLDTQELKDEGAVFKLRDQGSGTRAVVLLDSCGKLFSSEELAAFLATHRTRGTQQLTFAVGGPDGFRQESRSAADAVISLGRVTLPHELARVVLLEQIYRAFTILAGHPYHTGH